MTDHSDADGAFDDVADAPDAPVDAGTVVEVVAERLVAGGAALSRRDDGRIVLATGAVPGERVEVIAAERRGTLHGRTVRVLDPSPDRVEPQCRHAREGCGGCDLAHLSHVAQLDAKVGIVTDALHRIGGWTEPLVRRGPSLDPWSFRTSLRVAVVDGRAALRRMSSHDALVVPECEIAHPRLAELLTEGRFGDAREVSLRVGGSTGERSALVAPTAVGVHLPDDVLVVGADELRSGRRAWIHDEVAGRRWRVSADSFFQTRTDGADALVDVVRGLSADVLDGPPSLLLDAYCGVGLFAGSLLDGRAGWRGLAAERSRSSIADARVNLADLDVRVVATGIEKLRAPSAELVIADPSRSGLGRDAVRSLVAAGARRFVLVSCDPAAAGRDLALLVAAGYRPVESVVVDLFPHTHHVEVVTRFDR